MSVTYFLPAERASQEEVKATVQATLHNPVVTALLRSFSGGVLVLNRHRQIVGASLEALKLARVDNLERALGCRPGEAFQCVHASKAPGGCGTSEACRSCGTALAIAAVQYGEKASEKECHLEISSGDRRGSLELRVKVTPLALEGEELLVLCIQDISDRRRKETLERLFFHDLLNTAVALDSAGHLLGRAAPAQWPVLLGRLLRLSRRMIREVVEQRDWQALEQGHFVLKPEKMSVPELFAELEDAVTLLPIDGREVRIEAGAPEPLLVDRSLLLRVLVNMVKNAVEATAAGGQVRVWCEASGSQLLFRVWNAGEIASDVAPRIFERYFSTKGGRGRGLGTSSMKLLGERYLGGKVSFTTGAAEGTVFELALPRHGTQGSVAAGTVSV